jgi:hypothetical protein
VERADCHRLYWAPLTFCAVFYTVRTAGAYMEDKSNRAKAELARMAGNKVAYYYPSETLGRILGRALVTVLPVANLWAALFDLSPKVFSRLFEALGKVFDQPLVPPLK